MNVLYFTQIFYPFLYGGGEYVLFLMAKELAKRGENVYVITQRFKNTKPFEVFEGINIYRVGHELTYSGMMPPTIKHHLGYLISSFRKGSELIMEKDRKSQKVNIIHSNTYIPVISAQVCSSLHKIPHIVTWNSPVYQAYNKRFWTEWTLSQDPKPPFYTAIISKTLERMIMRLPIHTIHAVSEASKEDLVAFKVKDSKIKVIPNGLQLSQYQYDDCQTSSSHTEPTVVYVGRLVFYKNVQTVIKAFKNVVQAIPNARLVIVGDGPHKNNLIKEAECIKNNVEFTGRVDDREKIRIIKASSFIVFPSLYETFGMIVIEGFACKKPVLVSNIRPLSDIVKHGYTGFAIAPSDIGAWTTMIINLLNDKTMQAEMGSNAYQEFRSKYELEMVVSRIQKLYESMTNMHINGALEDCMKKP